MKKFLSKVYRFFIPKDFKAELRKGMQIGQQPGQSVGNALFQLGKGARKKVDPEHKMKFGKKEK